MKNLGQQGITHLAALVLVVLVVGIGGTYMLVSSEAKGRRINPYTKHCPGNSVKFGTPRGKTATAEARQKVFGPPETNLEVTSFQGKQVTVNKKIVNCLKAVDWDLTYKYKTNYKLNVIGGYNVVSAQNPPHYFHAYGGAVDINPAQNPQCMGGCEYDLPKSWVKAFRAHGFYWGGKFPNHKDYMHFEWHGQK